MSRQNGTANKPSIYVGAHDWAFFHALSKSALEDLVTKLTRSLSGNHAKWERAQEFAVTTLAARGDRLPTKPVWLFRKGGAR